MMTRRMLAAISALALATVATVAPLALFPGTATAQNPDYILSLTDASGPPGGLVDVQVMLDNNGDNIAGWSFGVAHDPAFVTLIDVEDGSTTLTVNGGGSPDFNQVNIYPDQGFSVGVVTSFTGASSLPGGTLNNELNVATYLLNPAGLCESDSQLQFVNTIGSPPYDTYVVVNGTSLVPTTEASTISMDSVPDIDCNNNGVPDLCDIAQGALDCNSNGELDECEIAVGSAPDCNANGILDDCEYSTASDCNGNGILDSCDLLYGVSEDCNLNNIPDECELDCDGNGIPDDCELITRDCNANGLIDICEINAGTVPDCNQNGTPDSCEYSAATDCNANGILDPCDILNGISEDCDENEVPDECDIAAGAADTDGDGIPDACAGQNFLRGECNGDDSITIADAIFLLGFLFNGGSAPTCQDACDINDDSGIDIGDGVYLLTYLFNNGPNPQNPFPTCGPDPTKDQLACESFGVCP